MQPGPPFHDRDQVLSRAVERWEADRAKQEQRDEQLAAEEAARELGIPLQYLRDAAADITRQKIAASRARRRRRAWFFAAPLALIALGFLSRVLYPVALFGWSQSFDHHDDWALRTNAESVARYDIARSGEGHSKVATVYVEAFRPPADGRYYVNLRIRQLPTTLMGYHNMVLSLRGEGSLKAARVYLRRDEHMRWRSPELPVTSEWAEIVVPLSEFERQVGGRGNWQLAAWEAPVRLDRLQLKLGYYINPIESYGKVQFDDLKFE